MRPCDSVTGTRCTRCTPPSYFSRAQTPSSAVRRLTATVTVLVAAEVGRSASSTSVVQPVPLGVAQVHPQQVAGEQRRLLAALARLDLEDDVLAVVGVLGQQQLAQPVLELPDGAVSASASAAKDGVLGGELAGGGEVAAGVFERPGGSTRGRAGRSGAPACAAVGRLDEDVVGVGHDRRVAQDRRARPAEVAGEDDRPLLPALGLLDAEPDDRGTQDVPRVHERGVDARRDLDLVAVVEGLELREGELGVLGRVQRRVEVDLEVRRLGAQLGLGVAWPGARRVAGFVHGFDGRGDVLGFLVAGRRGGDVGGGRGCGGAGGAARARPRLARGGQVDSRLVLVGLAPVVGLDLVGVPLLPACLALGELLVELAGVEQDERRELDRAGGGVDRTLVPAP